MRLVLKFIFYNVLFCALSLSAYDGGSKGGPQGGGWYTDKYGPLASIYTMGDFVRYTVDNSKFTSIYYGITKIPYAQDIFKYNNNTGNLYNTIGYLYAGYAALNDVIASPNLNPTYAKDRGEQRGLTNPSPQTISNWLSYRMDNQESLNQFDNNQTCKAPIILASFTTSINNADAFLGIQISGDGGYGFSNPSPELIDRGFGLLGYTPEGSPSNANASCAWSTNTDDGNYIMGWQVPASMYNLMLFDKSGNLVFPYKQLHQVDHMEFFNTSIAAAPYGQFFGARLSHILGSVTNDVAPVSGSTIGVESVPTMATGTPVPLMALLNGGSYSLSTDSQGSVTSTAPKGLVYPSTAHFGTMNRFIKNFSFGRNVVSDVQNYLKTHIGATTSRLSQLCSYQIDTNTNLININTPTITSYDNGVIVAIQNNTGNELQVYQVAGTKTTNIGTLKVGNNNHFLHTASLMYQGSASSSVANQPVSDTNQPSSDNAIKITDGKSSCYIQVLSGTQLSNLVDQFSKVVSSIPVQPNQSSSDSSGPIYFPLIYNQGLSFAENDSDSYMIISNFDTLNVAALVVSDLFQVRMQALNISKLQMQPYFVTLQINKENVNYGLINQLIEQGDTSESILYPSVVSLKTLLWQNPYNVRQSSSNNVYYTSMPLMLLPDAILNYNFAGLNSHYGIWLMSYAAALTEFFFNSEFGNNLDCLKNTFKVFDVNGIAYKEYNPQNFAQKTTTIQSGQNPPARVVIDVAGALKSGEVFSLPYATDLYKIQSTNSYLNIMGSDVWDIGQGFHQDIPMLYLYKTAQGGIVANKQGGKYINFAVTFGKPLTDESKFNTFGQMYGLPYSNMMLFSLPTDVMKKGIVANFIKYQNSNQVYQYFVTLSDTDGHVLAFQKAWVDITMYSNDSVTLSFLNKEDEGWNTVVNLPVALSVSKKPAASKKTQNIGQSFVVSYVVQDNKNQFAVRTKSEFDAQIDAQKKIEENSQSSLKTLDASEKVVLQNITKQLSIPSFQQVVSIPVVTSFARDGNASNIVDGPFAQFSSQGSFTSSAAQINLISGLLGETANETPISLKNGLKSIQVALTDENKKAWYVANFDANVLQNVPFSLFAEGMYVAVQLSEQENESHQIEKVAQVCIVDAAGRMYVCSEFITITSGLSYMNIGFNTQFSTESAGKISDTTATINFVPLDQRVCYRQQDLVKTLVAYILNPDTGVLQNVSSDSVKNSQNIFQQNITNFIQGIAFNFSMSDATGVITRYRASCGSSSFDHLLTIQNYIDGFYAVPVFFDAQNKVLTTQISNANQIQTCVLYLYSSQGKLIGQPITLQAAIQTNPFLDIFGQQINPGVLQNILQVEVDVASMGNVVSAMSQGQIPVGNEIMKNVSYPCILFVKYAAADLYQSVMMYPNVQQSAQSNKQSSGTTTEDKKTDTTKKSGATKKAVTSKKTDANTKAHANKKTIKKKSKKKKTPSAGVIDATGAALAASDQTGMKV